MERPWSVLIAVTVGGAIGSALRYLLSTKIYSLLGTQFPIGTLVVNLIGCFAIGLLLRLTLDLEGVSATTRALLTTGLIGGFTTFSTFAWEALGLIEEGAIGRAIGYLAASLVLGIAGVWLGSSIARAIVSLVRANAA